MTTADDYAAQIALKRGLVSAEQLATAQAKAAAHADLNGATPTVLDVLAIDAALGPEKLGPAMAEELGLPWVVLEARPIPAGVLATVPRSFVLEHAVIPYAREGGVLWVAITDPLAIDIIDDLAYVAGMVIQPALASVADVRAAVTRHYGTETDLPESGNEPGPATGATLPKSSGEEGQASDRDAPIIKLVQTIITEAIRRRASDIHLEPLDRRFRVRYRVDGVLLEVEAPPPRLQLAVISRVKIMANISIAEKRVPQDGRIQVEVDGRSLDLRVSSLPTAHGESIVMRILDKEGLKLGLPELGFLADDQRDFERHILSPDGIMLVTGPTGSGKTTTLYASLHHLNRPDRKIITVEEPVEYQLGGINQVPVNASIGMTFAAALRAMLRQAPNIVMVGEIRDLETAEIAINASLTGHMVFSTLHTNDAPSAVTRLIDLGAKPFLVAASLRSVLAQRLVRRICPACKRGYTPSARELYALDLKPGQLDGAAFAHGAGCVACHGTGFQGRMGIFELFPVTDGIRALIYDKVTAAHLRARARRYGMRTLREDGVRKVLAGLTTIEEVVTATAGDPL